MTNKLTTSWGDKFRELHATEQSAEAVILDFIVYIDEAERELADRMLTDKKTLEKEFSVESE